MPVTDYLTVEWAPADTPDDTTPTWVDISSNVERIKVKRGRDDELDVYAAGSAEILCNNGDSIDTPTIFDLDTWYRRRQIRIGSIFRGFIHDVRHDLRQSPIKASAVVECDDLLGLLADAELTGDWRDTYTVDNNIVFEHPIGDTEGFITRTGVADLIASMFAKLDGPAPTITATGNAPTMPIWVPWEQTGNIFQLAQQYLEAEGAWLAASPTALSLLYGGRWYPFFVAADDPGSIVATFSDTPAGGEFGYLKASVQWSNPGTTYANSVLCKSIDLDGLPQLAENIPAGWPRDSLRSRDAMPVIDDNWISASADLLLAVRSQTNTYPRQIKSLVWAQGKNATLHPGFDAQLGDIHKVEVTFPNDTQTSYTVFVESIEHEIDQESWYVTFGYTSADRWIDAYPDGFADGLFIIGTSTLGAGPIIAP
jgi:hypothetical protein